MEMNVFMPTRLLTGKGCVKAHAEEFSKLGKSCLIMTGKTSAKVCGALDDVTKALEEQKITWILYDRIGQNPKLTDCMEAAKIAIEQNLEFIIGIGGGSPIDAAKCAAVFAANPGMTREGLYSLVWENKPLPIAAVGTTAGTGTEVTSVAVITTPEGTKKSFRHDGTYPTVAFGDPGYTQTLSDVFTRSTAVDALAHCVESYFSRGANEISQTYAVKGIRILLEEFRQMVKDPQRKLSFEEREKLYFASIYGGLSINVTGTCAPHTMGYLLTEQHKVPHGVACAVFLPDFYAYNKDVMPELVERFLEETGCTEEEFIDLIQSITPEFPVDMTEEEIKREHGRWVGNSSMAKGWGHFSAELADEILRKKFI
jgi:alcohol dehydrogenase class IV